MNWRNPPKDLGFNGSPQQLPQSADYNSKIAKADVSMVWFPLPEQNHICLASMFAKEASR